MAVKGQKATGVGKKLHRPKSVTNTKTKTQRISPREISNFKNKETVQASKATLTLNSLKRAGKSSNHIIFDNNLKNPKIKVDATVLKKPRTKKELLKAQKGGFNKNKTARVTPGLPLRKTNKVGKGITGQQRRELLKYQRTTHAKILSSQMPKAGYISPGKGGKPSHIWEQKGKRATKPAITASNVGVGRRRRTR